MNTEENSKTAIGLGIDFGATSLTVDGYMDTWIDDYTDTGTIIDQDKECQKYVNIICDLWNSEYPFVDGRPELDEKKRAADAPAMLSAIRKLKDRINEINDGTYYFTYDAITADYRKYAPELAEKDHIRLQFCLYKFAEGGPIYGLGDEETHYFSNALHLATGTVIDDDQECLRLIEEMFLLHQSEEILGEKNRRIRLDPLKMKRDQKKMLADLELLKKRMDEINDGTFEIVEDRITPMYTTELEKKLGEKKV